MFYTFDYSQFPVVNVKLFNINDSTNLNELFNEWKNIYKKKKKFTLVFNTTTLVDSYLLFKHAFTVIDFIKELKKLPPLLEKSIIIAKNDIIKNLLYFIFQIQSPVSYIYIINNDVDVQKLLHQLSFSLDWYDEKVVQITPC